MKREIRLKESEFLRLIKRIVEETEKEEKKQKVSIFNISDAVAVAKDMAEEMLEDLDDDEIEELVDSLPDVNPKKVERELKSMVNSKEGQEILSKIDNNITEGILTESNTKKIISMLSRLGVLTGLGLTGAGLIGFMTNAMGYTDVGFLSSYFMDVHDMIQDEFGCDRFCGPLSTLIAFIGLFMALGSAKVGYESKKK
jgi:hypothetical protein